MGLMKRIPWARIKDLDIWMAICGQGGGGVYREGGAFVAMTKDYRLHADVEPVRTRHKTLGAAKAAAARRLRKIALRG